MTPDDHKLLQLEEHHPGNRPGKDGIVRTALNLSMTQYYQRLFVLLQTPEIVAVYPQMAKRVLAGRNVRSAKRRDRSAD